MSYTMMCSKLLDFLFQEVSVILLLGSQFQTSLWCCDARSLWYLIFNSLAPGKSGCDFKNGIFNLVVLIGVFRSSHDNALRWMPQDLTDDKSTLVQVMAWCHQATGHYLSQCWLSSLSPYGVPRPQWVRTLRLQQHDQQHWADNIIMERFFFSVWFKFPWSLL